MDYEYQIKALEKEVAHLREMKALHIGRLDSLDVRIEKLFELTRQNSQAIDRLTTNVDKLVAAILRDHPNGSN